MPSEYDLTYDAAQYKVWHLASDGTLTFLYATRLYHNFRDCDAFARASLNQMRKTGFRVGDFDKARMNVWVAIGQQWHKLDHRFASFFGDTVVAVTFTVDKATRKREEHQFLVETCI